MEQNELQIWNQRTHISLEHYETVDTPYMNTP